MSKMLPLADDPEIATDSVAIEGGMPGTGMPAGATESLLAAPLLLLLASAAITDSVWKPRLPAPFPRAYIPAVALCARDCSVICKSSRGCELAALTVTCCVATAKPVICTRTTYSPSAGNAS